MNLGNKLTEMKKIMNQLETIKKMIFFLLNKLEVMKTISHGPKQFIRFICTFIEAWHVWLPRMYNTTTKRTTNIGKSLKII